MTIPDAYAYTIFCDEVRQEITGKLLIIGMYDSDMTVHGQFPVKLPSFVFKVTGMQKRAALVANLGLRIFLPGDSDSEPSIQADMSETTEGVVQTTLDEIHNTLDPAIRANQDERVTMMSAILALRDLEIKQPGFMKVRVLRKGEMIRAGSLRVQAAPRPPAA